MTLTIAVAGSTKRTLQYIQALEKHPQFSISTVITPEPKRVGRKQILTTNPVHEWANVYNIPTHLVAKSLSNLKSAILDTETTNARPDYLLVVDFGYLVPRWLLDWPTHKALNIHPSDLPRWRGSSPAQFALLYGDISSAVSVIEMTEQLDQGPIVAQIPFDVTPIWTQEEFYSHSFDVVSAELAEIILKHANHTLQPKPQPQESPTPIAGRLKKDDAFISWELIQAAMSGKNPPESQLNTKKLSELLLQAYRATDDLTLVIERATRAFQPWPELWTIVKMDGVEKRMKIQEVALQKEPLYLKTVCIEGKPPTPWSGVKKNIQRE